ncbi:MAG: hypothetical protein FJW20_25770 [Acidimicrobiia bacterium]|nr:hypothetical protein [Acidimicrobiia bacterium]
MKLAPNMRTILWTAFLGGSMDDLFQDLELDASGVPVIAGHTTSPDFPTKSALQASRAGVRDAFVAKIAPADGSLIFSTYFGFNGADVINGVKMDAAGNIVAVGLTNSTNFPTNPGAVSPTIAGVDCFIARLSSDASRLVNATLFGGTQFDLCGNLEINAAGEIIVMGTTRLLAAGMTNNFPTTANAFQRTYGGGETDAFVARFNASLTQLLYSTFLGGSGDIDEPAFLTLDSAGNAVLGGRTNSPNFPLTADARTRTFRLPFTGWTARINTGAATGPRAAIIEASSESPSVDPPKTNSVRFTRTGKRITDTKFFDLLFVIVEVVQFENLDGSAYSETNFYAPEDYYGDGPPFSTVPQDFLGYILGCSKACMDGSTSNSPNSAAKQRVAIEFLI